MQIRRIKTSRINPAPYNPRKDLEPDDPEFQRLRRSIDEFGYVDPLIWNCRTSHLVGGHQRFKILLAQGLEEVEVSVVNLPLEKEKALNLALNKISGSWDEEKLAQLLDELLNEEDLDLGLTGFDMPEVEQLLAKVLDPLEEPDDPLDLDAALTQGGPPVTQVGERLELGVHGQLVLVCGDVTKPRDLQLLLGSRRADLCHTDPPYGVKYDRANRPTPPQRGSKPHSDGLMRNDDLTVGRYRKWFGKVADALKEAQVPGAPLYVWNAHKNFGLMHDLLEERDFKVSSVLTWAKESFSPGFGDYQEQVEYCLYGWRRGKRHPWYGPRNASTLWQVHRDRNYQHPTQKALELAERAIRNSSRREDTVFDPFLGSGTTLLAAAKLGRRCLGMEIEPRYCDVIVRRYLALAGKAAVSPEIAERYSLEEAKG